MKDNEYLIAIHAFFEKHSIQVDPSAIRAFKNPRYFNRDYLAELPDQVLQRNLEVIFLEVLELFHLRRRRALRSIPLAERHTLTSRDVYPVLRRHFCRLPPFCR